MKKLIHSFTARKIFELLLTLLIVTFLSFLLVKLSPVDAAEAYARRTFMLYTPEQLDELREEMGLNQPLLVQYGTWVGNALHLDFGTSLVNGRSVLGEVSRAMGVTLSIVLIVPVLRQGQHHGQKPLGFQRQRLVAQVMVTHNGIITGPFNTKNGHFITPLGIHGMKLHAA